MTQELFIPSQLRFTGLESFSTRSAFSDVKQSPSGRIFKDQFEFISQEVNADLLKKYPRLCIIKNGEEIETVFQSGKNGKVKLLTPALVIFKERVDEKHKFWKLVLPAVVKLPKHDNQWTLGFKNITNKNAPIEGFTYPEIAYHRKNVREATREDLDKLIADWQKKYTDGTSQSQTINL